MSTDTDDQRETPADGMGEERDSAIAKAAHDFKAQCAAAGGFENADILALLADAVKPITARSDSSRLVQAVYASLTLEEFLTLKMYLTERLSVEDIAQRQGRSAQAVRSEIARGTALIRFYQPKRPAGTDNG